MLKQWGIRLVIATIATTVALVLIEQVMRLYRVVPTRTTYATQFIEHDSLRGWRNVPGARGHYTTDEFHVALEYNARGFRGPLPPRERDADDYRVVMLGDSFVEGFTVAEDERVSAVLQRRIANGDETRTGEVIALGTSGYATDQQLLWLETEGVQYAPDLVVLMLYYNDIWANVHARYSFGDKPRFTVVGDSLCLVNVPVSARRTAATPERGVVPRALAWTRENSRIAALASRVVKSSPRLRAVAVDLGLAEMPGVPAGNDMAQGLPAEFRPFTEPFAPAVDSAWQVTEALITRMRDVSERADARFMVFYVPFRSTIQLSGHATPEDSTLPAIAPGADSVAIRLAGMCARRGIDCLDPTWEFVAAARGLARSGGRLYFNYDWHWNAAGHALAADLLAAHVARQRAGFGGD